MKRKSPTYSAFFNLRVLLLLLLCITACWVATGAPLAFLHPEKPANASQRTLTFEERVSYQRAIEEVYWRHRIWPKENSNPKPPLDAVMSQAQLEKKVKDYLRNSQMLDDYWQRPITAEQLQAEMDRMATHTKQPEVLQELFEALGNDPFMIAECLARPALAERLITNWYAYDQRIHGELKQRAEADLQAHPTTEEMRESSGNYSEIEFVKSDSADGKSKHNTGHSVKLNSREWEETVQTLAAMLNQSESRRSNGRTPAALGSRPFDPVESYETMSVAKVSPLQEDETRYYATAILNKTADRVRIGRISWSKEPFESWTARAESQAPHVISARTNNYTLPKISEGGCIDDTWTTTAGPPDARSSHTAIWTGSEMIVWGGLRSATSTYLDDGARYNPSTDSWTPTSGIDTPTARAYHTAVWTGSEMIVWGGYSQEGGGDLNSGGRYDPSTDSWTTTSTTNAPTGREIHTAIWTGTEMIVWGGYDISGFQVNTGGRYNAATNSWTATSTNNAPSARVNHTASWTGSEMIIWGGYDGSTGVNTGARYDPDTDSWTETSTSGAPTGRDNHTAVWTGSTMIVWGGIDDSGNNPNSGGRYDPVTNSWVATSTVDAPDGRWFHTAVWTGSEMIVWGGYSSAFGFLNTGARYDPGTNSWTATSTDNAPSARKQHVAVWSGSQMIVWGGTSNLVEVNSGGRYDPATNSWTATGASSAPATRASHTAVWTGSEMIVWGGSGDLGILNTGARYDPTIDNWTPINTNAPTARVSHTAVWSGSEMIVWGGTDENFVRLNTGGKYNPTTDGWSVTSTANAPSGRYSHSAVWTGSEMIVWGGTNDSTTFNTGGRYNPSANSWAATTATNAPTARSSHTAVWTGSEMIVWGGGVVANFVDTGGRYNPGTNSWIATNATNTPEARGKHTAVWTGSEMIVWGGTDVFDDFNTGGKYSPTTDSWVPTSITNAPSGRHGHTAVLTGSEMIIWGGGPRLSIGGRYDPVTDSWTAMSTTNSPSRREYHTAVWTGSEMIVWGGTDQFFYFFNSGGRYCAQSGPPPTPTPTPRVTPRAKPTPHLRPAPP